MKTIPVALWGLATACCAAIALAQRRRSRMQAAAQLQALRQALAAHAREARHLDHEFRTPLGAAAVALEILQSAMDDPAVQAEAREVIARQLGRMTALADALRAAAQRLGSAGGEQSSPNAR